MLQQLDLETSGSPPVDEEVCAGGTQQRSQDAAFADPKFYWPVPGYQFPDHFVELDGAVDLQKVSGDYWSGPKRAAMASLASVGVLKHVVPYYSIVAHK